MRVLNGMRIRVENDCKYGGKTEKSSIFRSICFLILLFFFTLVFFEAFSSEQDLLWQKAVEVAAANSDWIPEKVIHYEEVYSRLGIRQEVTETHSTLQKLESGEVELTFEKVVYNGRDITEEFLEEFGKTLILEESEYHVEHPFQRIPAKLTDAPQNKAVEYEQKGRTRTILGKSCILYEFIYTNEKGTWEGTAWLEESTGIPVLVEGTLVTVPLDEKWYTISDLKIITEYVTNGNGAWYPGKSIVDSSIEMDGGLLHTYKGRIKETYSFGNYRRYK